MSDTARKDDSNEAAIPEWLKIETPLDGYTYKEYKNWDDNIKVELDDGMVYMMGSGDPWHQWLIGELGGQLRNQLLGKKCRYFPEQDVRLFYEVDESDRTVFRPDIIVVCDEAKTKGHKTCQGAPDFIIEIISERSEDRDLYRKKKVYEKAGVKEYWVVGADKLHVFLPEGGKYRETILEINANLVQPVSCLEGCSIDFKPIADNNTGLGVS